MTFNEWKAVKIVFLIMSILVVALVIPTAIFGAIYFILASCATVFCALIVMAWLVVLEELEEREKSGDKQ